MPVELAIRGGMLVDGTGSVPYWGSVFSTRLDGLAKHGGAPSVYQQRTRPCPGIEFLSSPHFPEEMQGNLLVGNVIGADFQTVGGTCIESQGRGTTISWS